MDAILGFNCGVGVNIKYSILGLYALNWVAGANYNTQSVKFSSMPELNDADAFAICIFGGSYRSGSTDVAFFPSCDLFSGPQMRLEIDEGADKNFAVFSHGQAVATGRANTVQIFTIQTGGIMTDPQITFTSSSLSNFMVSAAVVYMKF